MAGYQGSGSVGMPRGSSGGGGTTGRGMVDDVTTAARDAVTSASNMAGDVYEQGSRYVRDASDYVPDLGEYADYVRRPFEQSPLITALAVGAIGYLAAYLIHGGGFGSLQAAHPEPNRHSSKRSRRRHRH